MVEFLREAGIKVEPHRDHFSPEEEDHVWIPQCANHGWLIVTSDKGIETDPINRASVLESKARVFILQDGNNGPSHWAASIIVSRARIYDLVRVHEGPFFVDVFRETRLMVKNLRSPWLKPDSPTKETIIIHAPPEGAMMGAE